METSLSFSILRAAMSRGRFFPLQHEELTVFAVNTAPIPWISGELELFQSFSFCHFCRLGIPFKATTPKTFLSLQRCYLSLADIEIQKNHFCVLPTRHLGQVGGTESLFLGIVHLPRGGSGRKKKYFLFQVEKQGVSSWSDLVSLLGPGRGKNASHLDISRCRRKFLRQQLLKCAILTFFFFFLF